jgi:hypothetical protein
MSDANENINASSTKMPSADLSGMDTKTRKTVRIGVAPQGLAPNTETVISDPLSGRDTDTSNLEILDDTQTRRTVKIKPIAAAARTTVKLNVDEGATGAAPASSDAEDTQTRKTLVLKPLSGAVRPSVAPSAAPAAEKTPAAGALTSDGTMRLKKPIPRPMTTQTLQPAAAAAPATPGNEQTVTLAPPPVAAKPTAIAVNDADDTTTRKTNIQPDPQTITLTPGDVKTASPTTEQTVTLSAASIKPATAVAVNDGDDTSTRKAVAVPPTAGASGAEDQTMKLARPQKPAIPPRPTVAGATAPKIPALKPAAKPGVPPMGAKPAAPGAPTVVAPPTQTLQPSPAPAAAPSPELAPKPTPAAPAPATAAKVAETPSTAAPEKKADDDLVLAPSMKEKKAAEEKKAEEADPKAYLAAKKAAEKAKKAAKEGENQPSVFYLVVALLTIAAVAVCVLYTTVHYLDFEQKVKIYDKVSFVPLMDKNK